VFDDLLTKFDDIFRLCHQFHSLVRHSLGNSQDRSLFWLHNGLVSRLCRSDEGIRKSRRRDLIHRLYFFCKASEKLGKNNAGVAAGAS